MWPGPTIVSLIICPYPRFFKNCLQYNYSSSAKMMRKVRIYQDGVLTASPKPLSSSLPLSGPSEEESLTREKEKVELPERDETPPIKVLGWLARSYELFKHSFLPQGFPSSVHPNFTPYAGWFFLQNIVGTCVYGNQMTILWSILHNSLPP